MLPKNTFLYCLFCILLAPAPISGQEISDYYEFFCEIERPGEFKNSMPGDILIDTTLGYMAVDFGFKPANIILYSLRDFAPVKKFQVKGFAGISSSYFDIYEQALYVDRLKASGQYLRIDLNTSTQSKVKCEDLPIKCDYDPIPISNHIVGNENQDFIIMWENYQYILVTYFDVFKIYLRKGFYYPRTDG